MSKKLKTIKDSFLQLKTKKEKINNNKKRDLNSKKEIISKTLKHFENDKYFLKELNQAVKDLNSDQIKCKFIFKNSDWFHETIVFNEIIFEINDSEDVFDSQNYAEIILRLDISLIEIETNISISNLQSLPTTNFSFKDILNSEKKLKKIKETFIKKIYLIAKKLLVHLR